MEDPGISWEDLTNFFMKTLLETQSNLHLQINNKSQRKSKSTVDKVTNPKQSYLADMINKLKLVIFEWW